MPSRSLSLLLIEYGYLKLGLISAAGIARVSCRLKGQGPTLPFIGGQEPQVHRPHLEQVAGPKYAYLEGRRYVICVSIRWCTDLTICHKNNPKFTRSECWCSRLLRDKPIRDSHNSGLFNLTRPTLAPHHLSCKISHPQPQSAFEFRTPQLLGNWLLLEHGNAGGCKVQLAVGKWHQNIHRSRNVWILVLNVTIHLLLFFSLVWDLMIQQTIK